MARPCSGATGPTYRNGGDAISDETAGRTAYPRGEPMPPVTSEPVGVLARAERLGRRSDR